MGRQGVYNEEYPAGTTVRIAPQNELEEFFRTWKLHHPLEENQLSFAGKIALVKDVSFYHGGDELYQLENIPGTWHECCLKPG